MLELGMSNKPYASPELLRELLDYIPETGDLIWKPREERLMNSPCRDPAEASRAWNNKFAAKKAFTAVRRGYRVGNVYGRTYPAHRVAWAIHHGDWPTGDIDHIDGDRQNNAITNLRDVTRAINLRNMRMSRHNTTGFTGVYRNTHTWKWSAKIWLNNRSVHLGYFATAEEAVAARKRAQEENGFSATHGMRR